MDLSDERPAFSMNALKSSIEFLNVLSTQLGTVDGRGKLVQVAVRPRYHVRGRIGVEGLATISGAPGILVELLVLRVYDAYLAAGTMMLSVHREERRSVAYGPHQSDLVLRIVGLGAAFNHVKVPGVR